MGGVLVRQTFHVIALPYSVSLTWSPPGTGQEAATRYGQRVPFFRHITTGGPVLIWPLMAGLPQLSVHPHTYSLALGKPFACARGLNMQ